MTRRNCRIDRCAAYSCAAANMVDFPVMMITAYGTVENAVRAMQAGAVNFIQKPWDNEKLLADVRAIVGRRRAEEENEQLKRALKQRYNFENIVGKSDSMLKIFDLVSQDPVVSRAKLIAEPWDVGRPDSYDLGRFHPLWSEWNGRYRDVTRSL